MKNYIKITEQLAIGNWQKVNGKHYLLPLACSLLLVFFSCKGKEQKEDNTEAPTSEKIVLLTDAQLKNAGVLTGNMEQRSVSSVLKVSGSIDVPPQNKVSISVPLGGYLKSTKLLPGMHISKGESIAIMEDQQYIQLQQDYLIAKSKLVFTESEYNRQRELNQSKATSDKVFQQASSDFTSQKVLVKSLSEKLRLIGLNPETLTENNLSRSVNIPSPINGFVAKVNVNIGKYAKPEDVLFEIVNPADIHLALDIFEKDINKLYIGQKVTTYTNVNPEKKYKCEIILIGKDFSADRSVEVHCHFENYDKTLIPGMFMNAEIEVKNKQANVLPSDAVVSFENKKFVFAANGKNEFEIIEVKTGDSENGYTQILNDSNLSGRSFVVKGAYSLLMKMKNVEE